METLKTLEVETKLGRSEIRLAWGNLMDTGRDGRSDLLVVSTFPNDYTPTPSSLVGQLYFRGVNLAELSRERAVDLGARFGSWLSHDIGPLQSGVQARRILCVEGANPQRLFRSLVAVLSDAEHPVRVAMPVIGTGDQHYPFADVVAATLEAAVEWMLLGLPVRLLEIVIPNKKRALEAANIFEAFVRDRVVSALRLREPTGEAAPRPETDDEAIATVAAKADGRLHGEYPFDLFLSYAHEDRQAAESLLSGLESEQVRVFLDRKDIAPGTVWQQQIYSGLDNCRRIAALLSESYLESEMCIEEFNIAKVRQREEKQPILTPVYLRSTTLPTYMKIHQWIDCREADEVKIQGAAAKLARLCLS